MINFYYKQLLWLVAIIVVVTNLLGVMVVFKSAQFLQQINEVLKIPVRLLWALDLGLYPLYIFALVWLFRQRQSLASRVIIWIMILVALLTISAEVYLNFLESIHYENYVFGNYGVYLPYLLQLGNLQMVVLVLGILGLLKEKLDIKKTLNLSKEARNYPWLSIGWLVIWLLLVVKIFITMINQLSHWVVPEYRSFYLYAKLSADQRVEIGMNDFHQLSLWIESQTPEQAVIFHPRQSSVFPVFGNQVLIRYYLFPRVLVSDRLVDHYWRDHVSGRPVFSLLTSGNSESGRVIYPDYAIDSEWIKVWLIDDTIHIFEGIKYTPALIEKLGEFKIGLVKHRFK